MPARDPADPVVVSGMHCSATSLLASLVAGLGIDLGSRQLPSDAHNPEGYFEDLDFVELQSRMTAAATRAEELGHHDWGWTESESFADRVLGAYRQEAAALIAHKSAGMRRWGWKNPRTAVALDFWQDLLPSARHLMIYRYPWEVADSMQRLGAEVFLRHPDYAYRIWSFYNRRLLSFYRQHPEQCLLVSANALLASPERLDHFLQDHLQTPVEPGYARSRLRPKGVPVEGGDSPLITLLAAVRPDCLELLRELDAHAALSSAGLWSPRLLITRSPPKPRVSVIVPCRDHGEFALEAIASAERAAERCDLEVVIVNDGSQQPWTLEVLEGMRRLGYRVCDQVQSGLAAARNRGAAAARGEYLLPLDADDRLRPDFAASALGLLEADPAAGVAYGDYWEFGLRQGRVPAPQFSLPTLLRGNYIAACALIRRSALMQAGGWDERMDAWEDWELWIGIAAAGWGFRRSETIAFDYRRRPDSMVASYFRPGVGARLQQYLVEKHRATYLAQLPSILIEVQDAHRDAEELRRSLAADQPAGNIPPAAAVPASLDDPYTRARPSGMSPSPKPSAARSQGDAEAIDFDQALRRQERSDLSAHWRRTADHLAEQRRAVAAERAAAAGHLLALEGLAAEHALLPARIPGLKRLAAEHAELSARMPELESVAAEHAALARRMEEFERLAAFERAVRRSRGWRLLELLRRTVGRAG